MSAMFKGPAVPETVPDGAVAVPGAWLEVEEEADVEDEESISSAVGVRLVLDSDPSVWGDNALDCRGVDCGRGPETDD